MRLTQAELNRYRKEVDIAADSAGSYVLDAMEAFLRVYPDADTAAMRNFVIELLQVSLPNFCDAAATLSADLFDELAETLGEDVETKLYDTIDYDKVEQKVRYFAKFLNEGDSERFKQEVADVTRYYVKRSAFDNMRENCKGQKVKWARVPTGFETCPFCFMLASRGFVYGNEKKAIVDHKTGDKYHVHCDCIAIPGFEDEDGNPRVKIDGYDPQVMYENWCECAKTVGIDPQRKKTAWTDDERKAVMKEVETRDWHWLYTGKKHGVAYASESLKLEKMVKYPHEIKTAEKLNEFGITCNFVRDEIPEIVNGKKTGNNISYADFGSGFELKTTKEASSYNTINGHLKNASKKRNAKYVVFDNRGNKNMSDEQLIKWLNESRTFRRGRVYIIDQQGNYRYIR